MKVYCVIVWISSIHWYLMDHAQYDWIIIICLNDFI